MQMRQDPGVRDASQRENGARRVAAVEIRKPTGQQAKNAMVDTTINATIKTVIELSFPSFSPSAPALPPRTARGVAQRQDP